jgi:hypothetical protein
MLTHALMEQTRLVAAAGEYKQFHQHSVLLLHAQAQIL